MTNAVSFLNNSCNMVSYTQPTLQDGLTEQHQQSRTGHHPFYSITLHPIDLDMHLISNSSVFLCFSPCSSSSGSCGFLLAMWCLSCRVAADPRLCLHGSCGGD